MTPYLADPDVTVYQGDAPETLRELPSGSVHMCCTSPPFYGLRDYNAEGQIGLEDSPQEWCDRLVEVFREVRRVLRDDGTLWVEIGDSYASSQASDSRTSEERSRSSTLGPKRDGLGGQNAAHVAVSFEPRKLNAGTKPKDLLGQPWLLAFALRADGWYLRSEIIWARPNPMPESVTDRPTKAHSTVFLLSKQPRYYYDQEAVRQPLQPSSVARGEYGHSSFGKSQFNGSPTDERHQEGKQVAKVSDLQNPAGANARSVWTIATEPTPFAHFATWPQALCRRMILAGTSERGVCPECGAPWVRDMEKGDLKPVRGDYIGPIEEHKEDGSAAVIYNAGKAMVRTTEGWSLLKRQWIDKGWKPSCGCYDDPNIESDSDGTPIPATVLDPFGGAGTTAIVARKLGRRAILIELNPSYCALTSDRLRQQSLFAEPVA